MTIPPFSQELKRLIESEPKMPSADEQFERLNGMPEFYQNVFTFQETDQAKFNWLVNLRFRELVDMQDPDLIYNAKTFLESPSKTIVVTADFKTHTVTTESHREAIKKNFHLLSNCVIIEEGSE